MLLLFARTSLVIQKEGSPGAVLIHDCLIVPFLEWYFVYQLMEPELFVSFLQMQCNSDAFFCQLFINRYNLGSEFPGTFMYNSPFDFHSSNYFHFEYNFLPNLEMNCWIS